MNRVPLLANAARCGIKVVVAPGTAEKDCPPLSLRYRLVLPLRDTPTMILWVTPPETLLPSKITKLIPFSLGVVVTSRELNRVQVAPASVLLNNPFHRVPQYRMLLLLGSTTSFSPVCRPIPLPCALNWLVTSVTAKVLP